MKNPDRNGDRAAAEAEVAAADGRQPQSPIQPGPYIPVPYIPYLLAVSGLYTWTSPIFKLPEIPERIPFPDLPIPGPFPGPIPGPGPDPGPLPTPIPRPTPTPGRGFSPFFFQREELRLDVDGRYPQDTVSGTLFSGGTYRVHWIAELAKVGTNHWTGSIWFKDGDTSYLPYTNVDVTATSAWYVSQRKVTVVFSGGGAANQTRIYDFQSSYFHDVEFEYDTVTGTSAVTSINTYDHPNHPSTIASETLTIDTVYRRAGFNVSNSGGNSPVPIGEAGTDSLWTDMEMHDAMQTYWSRFGNTAQWSMWVLFASQHAAVPSQGITPQNLGGIMFDDIGPNHRQGTSIFNDAFIKNAPSGDPDPTAWVKRMRFWTAVHEMGHAFNLAHSWQKSLGSPWIPLANEPEARSFMNYPYNVAGGQSAFFSDFEFGFSDSELIFLRHAPARFVQMGNADWFDDHGFQEHQHAPENEFALELRVHREIDHFEFLEPVTVELKLTNTSDEPQIVEESLLYDEHEMTVILKKDGGAARRFVPYAQRFYSPAKTVMNPGDSKYAPLSISAGLNGFDIAEPGYYTVQVALHMDDGTVTSNPLRVRIAPPRGYDEEFIAQDFYTEDVGRTLAFDGSRVLEAGNDALREVVERLGDRRVAHHARLALANPLTRDYKTLVVDDSTAGGPTSVAAANGTVKLVRVKKADASAAKKELDAALGDADVAADTFGHISYRGYVDSYSAFLAETGDENAAASCQKTLHKTLESRGVLTSVLKNIEQKAASYASNSAKSSSSSGSRKKTTSVKSRSTAK